MIESDRLVQAQGSAEDVAVDNAIRPSTLADYVGQSAVCEQMEIFIYAAKKLEEALDHVLLFYASLQSAIADWLNRADLTAVIPTFIQMCDAQLKRRIKTKFKNTLALSMSK